MSGTVPPPAPNKAAARAKLTPRFVPTAAGRLHVAGWNPESGSASASILLVPPFAEEMNKCRRMLALLGDRLGGRGCQVVLPDLFGTGDSEGEFAEARIESWRSGLEEVSARLAAEGRPVVAIVALRFGALLAVDIAARLPALRRLVLWQPVTSGQTVLTQFLRLRMAGGLLGAGGGETVADLRAALQAGQTLEVAGYPITPGLAADLDALKLGGMELPASVAVNWYEVSQAESPQLSRPADLQLAEWRAAGIAVAGAVCRGDTFWSTVEISTVPELVTVTADALESLCRR